MSPTSCPCPKCFKCCCAQVEGLDPDDCVNGDEGVCSCEEQGEFAPVLAALLGTEDAPVNYALTEFDVAAIAACYDWESRVDESNWSADTDYDTLAEMIAAEPAGFLADISRYYGDDYYLGREDEDERRVNWLCQCGNGGLMVPESEVPASCPVCGHDVGPARGDDLDMDDLYDDSMDGDHESALESVYGPND